MQANMKSQFEEVIPTVDDIAALRKLAQALEHSARREGRRSHKGERKEKVLYSSASDSTK